MQPSFVHLHCHTEYSLVDGVVRIPALVDAVREAGMPAVAVTDQNNLFALVRFYKAAQKAGIKPIVGVDLWVEDEEGVATPNRLLLLCKDDQGYRNLTELISKGYLEGQHGGSPVLKQEWLEGRCDGLIALSGGREGDVGRALLAGKQDLAAELIAKWLRRFGDNYYLELQRTGREGEEDYLHAAVGLAAAMSVPVVATNDVRFVRREDFDAHEARVCIHDGRVLDDPRRPRNYTDQQYLRTPEEMAELFADIPEALENTVEVARRCSLSLTLGEYVLPDFPVPDGMTEEQYFRQQAWAGLERRLERLLDPEAPDFAERRRPYDERLERELEVILQMGFPGYFLIVADFIQWAKRNDIPVGPGRGSGAGSLVAYALTITDLDPLRYDLLFERFLNPERVSMPDFDVDFCMEGRDRVIDYVAERYGREKVSQIITYGSMAAKAVVRDVGRVLGYPYGFVDQIAKLIPFEVGMTLEKALAQEEALRERYEQEEDVQTVLDMARSLEGITRNAGKHAGGVVIAPSRITDYAPLYCEPGGEGVVTQFDKDDVESVGLVKFDFLGLRTLTIIDWALENIRATDSAGPNRDARSAPVGGVPGMARINRGDADKLDISAIPLDDPAAFDLLKACQTTAVFQLESRGMKELIGRLQPDTFEDIIALVALFRPGPLQSGMVDDFVNRKHGHQKVEYPHPDLEPILRPTYGVILYQEQVQRIAQVLANYTLGGADLLRRAMGKKKPEEMAKQREIFMEGATGRGVDKETATYIFDLMEKFAGYGFNKSHSAAYALVSYQTAWLKAHHPACFMAATLSADMDNTDKVVTLIDECLSTGLEVAPPDVNRSAHRFTVGADGTVVYGLGAIKGVGEGAIAGIVAERERGGPFQDLFDLCRRVDLRKANRRVLEALIRAGAMDNLGPNRATLMGALPAALQAAEQHQEDRATGLVDMFGFEAAQNEATGYRTVPEWPEDERLAGEKETLGLYLTGHPIEQFREELARFTTARIVDLKPTRDQTVVVAGLVVALRTMRTRRGDKMAFVTLDDRSGRVELAVFADDFERYRDLLGKDKVIVVEGEVSVDEYSGGYRMSARAVYDMDRARERYARGLVVAVDRGRAGNGFVDDLEQTLSPFREGGCPVWVDYLGDGAAARLELGEDWRVRPSEELLHRLRQLAGEEGVRMEYA